jgi:hypothetical protein
MYTDEERARILAETRQLLADTEHIEHEFAERQHMIDSGRLVVPPPRVQPKAPTMMYRSRTSPPPPKQQPMVTRAEFGRFQKAIERAIAQFVVRHTAKREQVLRDEIDRLRTEVRDLRAELGVRHEIDQLRDQVSVLRSNQVLDLQAEPRQPTTRRRA